MKHLMVVVGTRPNFMKVTRFKDVARQQGLHVQLVHTGQHADDRMSTVFFDQFGLRPDRMLSVPDGSPAARMGHLILALESVMRESRPDGVMVVGDVDSTLAAAIAANKLSLALAHLESGLRSRDLGMPEEVNRILTDRMAGLLLTTEPSGAENLIAEGIAPERIRMVGNTMIDTLVAYDDGIQGSDVLPHFGLRGSGHALITMHRPGNVDEPAALARVVDLVRMVADRFPAVFPVHPRTARNLQEHGLADRLSSHPGITLCDPLGYFDFQKLVATSAVVITDSGGIQEETTFRGVPCLTLRPSTERPITITEGSNSLITFDLQVLDRILERIARGEFKKGKVPHLWDGHATERAVEALMRWL
ncbi:MAG: UDP-N-acetylglucosamine 2-epimerase (non-hydrolyzing) [Flavobacteriales bacterium]|nr:UDP-N-acetylglucosamine 2-epimerase (non-hydrolyzing) [Flavobacteriales bacterium]